jgi:mannose-6-phosphate isomerase-like protein (cupin superfamily)
MTTPRTLPASLDALIDAVESRRPLGEDVDADAWVRSPLSAGRALYAHRNDALNIDFTVDRLAFPAVQAMDPRVLRIAPGRNNELHKHAHESLFVVLAGEGEVRVGDAWRPLRTGDVAFVPRWIFHQTRNTSSTAELVILAITDFGLTKAVLGDYDRRTRLAQGGEDVTAER